MAFDKGFNFRGSAGFVTDGTDETYVIGDLYPTTRNGVTFGWNGAVSNTIDRDNGVDRRLAGLNNVVITTVFSVDLPAAGSYSIRLAIGDVGASAVDQMFYVKDTSTILLSFEFLDTAAAEFYDASVVKRTSAADWVANNAAVQVSFSTTTFNLENVLESGGGSRIAHIFISEVMPASLGWLPRHTSLQGEKGAQQARTGFIPPMSGVT